jgi:CRISPR/Cas system-associated exonuclease Cas4 (RecB family)
MEDVRLDLHGWLTIWREQRQEWRPLHSEFPFQETKLLDGFLVTGKIDLIEKKQSELRVTDFKTGRPPKAPGQVDGGRKLQPALYAAAAQQTLGHPVTAARLFYATQRGAYTEHSVKLDTHTFQSVQSVLDCIAQDLSAGRLLPAPSPGGCDYCDFQLVCGPAEERRLRQKDLTKLERLQQVRSLP